MFLENNDWFRPKRYAHFDSKINDDQLNEFLDYVGSPSIVAKHPFLPLLQYEKPKCKIVADLLTNKRFADRSGTRSICYSSHYDSLIYSYYAQILSTRYEACLKASGLADHVIAFRKIKDAKTKKSKSNIHFANDAFEAIREFGTCSVWALDIKSFFDSLDPQILKHNWQLLLGVKSLPIDHYKIFRSVTKFSFVNKYEAFERLGITSEKNVYRLCNSEEFRQQIRGGDLIRTKTVGIPQGTPISAVLANIYMLGFDQIVGDKVSSLGGRYYRYCDDLMIILPTKNIDIEAFVVDELANIKLKLNVAKTAKAEFFIEESELVCDRSIQYLGFVFDGKSKSVRPGSISKFLAESRKKIRLAVRTQAKHNKVRRKKQQPETTLYKKKLYSQLTHIGKRNFPSYVLRASKIMKSPQLRKQAKKLNIAIVNEIQRASSEQNEKIESRKKLKLQFDGVSL